MHPSVQHEYNAFMHSSNKEERKIKSGHSRYVTRIIILPFSDFVANKIWLYLFFALAQPKAMVEVTYSQMEPFHPSIPKL
jgi:hypothetical protein